MINTPATANKSFLYNSSVALDKKNECPSQNNKIIYATLDSLALKRATLPLRLLPENNEKKLINDNSLNNILRKNTDTENNKELNQRNRNSKRPSFKRKNNPQINGAHHNKTRAKTKLKSKSSIERKNNDDRPSVPPKPPNLKRPPTIKIIRHEEIKDSENDKIYAEIDSNFIKRKPSPDPALANDSFLWGKLSQNQNSSTNDTNEEESFYDDIGPVNKDSVDNVAISIPENDSSGVYDDVGPGTGEILNNEIIEDERVYDDVLPLDTKEESHYDTVEPREKSDKECQERINSLYAGSSFIIPIEKESEWEDLEDPDSRESYCNSSSPMKKKIAGQRWGRNKVRRHCSKLSRKSTASVGSFVKRSKAQYSDSSDDSNYETLEAYENSDNFSSDEEFVKQHIKTEELLINNNKLIDNNIEKLNNNNDNDTLQPTTPITTILPPNRPTPPIPSITRSLGRRMKILKRTWSLTGTFGRTSLNNFKKHFSTRINNHNINNSHNNNNINNNNAASSTFYLDKEFIDDCYVQAGLYENAQNSKASDEESNTYSNIAENTYSNVEENNYSVLAEEPLYQFYAAAAAARNAFESDSDGYEEVEELMPTLATTELAKPGHRTLWYQTPQVIASGLLQKLTIEERKVHEAKFEILTSEASYLNSLRVLENEFVSNHELFYEILTPSEKERLFGNIPDILAASERFLAELEAVWKEDVTLKKLPELLIRHGERSQAVYVKYCSNQVSIDTTLKELRSKKGFKFLETVSRIEMRPACQSLSLHSFLMLPMQRITRLPLLADAVVSKLSADHPERISWENVLSSLSYVVARCNEGARQAERRNEMEALARKLEYSSKVPPIILRDRELIRSGPVIQFSSKSDTEYKLTFGKKFHKTPLFLMLLTDYLLVAKLKTNSNEETYSVIETCKRSLLTLEAASEDSPFAGRHAMILTILENHVGRQVDYVLTCENETEKERWLDAVSPPKPTIVGETLYESWDCPQVMALYSYTSRQPDELNLQPGDVINVLRKMNDGWLFGEKLLDGEQGWFPGNFTKEVASEHVRARNLKQRHRFLALSGNAQQRKSKQSLS